MRKVKLDSKSRAILIIVELGVFAIKRGRLDVTKGVL